MLLRFSKKCRLMLLDLLTILIQISLKPNNQEKQLLSFIFPMHILTWTTQSEQLLTAACTIVVGQFPKQDKVLCKQDFGEQYPTVQTRVIFL